MKAKIIKAITTLFVFAFMAVKSRRRTTILREAKDDAGFQSLSKLCAALGLRCITAP
jgi:hypothetical protein